MEYGAVIMPQLVGLHKTYVKQHGSVKPGLKVLKIYGTNVRSKLIYPVANPTCSCITVYSMSSFSRNGAFNSICF